MTTLFLRGRTNKANGILSKTGNVWLIKDTKQSVSFSDMEGPWYYVTPLANTDVTHTRWVHSTNDMLFTVEKL